MQESQEKIAGEGERSAGGQRADPRGGGDNRTGDRAEDEGDEDAGGIGPGVFHAARKVLTAEGAEGTE